VGLEEKEEWTNGRYKPGSLVNNWCRVDSHGQNKTSEDMASLHGILLFTEF